MKVLKKLKTFSNLLEMSESFQKILKDLRMARKFFR